MGNDASTWAALKEQVTRETHFLGKKATSAPWHLTCRWVWPHQYPIVLFICMSAFTAAASGLFSLEIRVTPMLPRSNSALWGRVACATPCGCHCVVFTHLLQGLAGGHPAACCPPRRASVLVADLHPGGLGHSTAPCSRQRRASCARRSTVLGSWKWPSWIFIFFFQVIF